MAENRGAGRTRWVARPVLASALSIAGFAVPLLLSYLVTVSLAPLVLGLPVWWRILLLGTLAVAVGLAAERALRRVLPVAALLRMTMLFPDRAPSRFAVARAAGTPRLLLERSRTHPGETAGEAATRILGLVAALSAHDRRTRGHSERVRVFTDVIAAELHLGRDDRDRLRWAALLHDLGKLDVPTKILNKPATLDADEWKVVREHPARGAVLAGPLLEWLGPWGAAIAEHHERFDGLGYPRGISGHDIALAGRVVAVADVFEVMTAARSYKRPMSVRAARAELAGVAGTQLDPMCVRALLGASLPRVIWAVGPLALLVNAPFLRSLADVGRAVEQAGTAAAGQAATAAVAATTAVVVVAAPSVGAVEATDSTPRPSVSPTASAGTGQAASRTRSATDPSSAPTPSSSGTSPPDPRPTTPGASADPSATGAATPTPTRSVTSSLSPSPQPTATTGASPSASTSGSAQDPATPVIVGPVSLVLLQPVVFLFTSVDVGVSFECRVDGEARKVCTSPVSYSGLDQGDHRFEVYAVDAKGRKSDTARWYFTVA